MFIDEKTNTKIYAELGRSVSKGTLRPCDLIPIFLDVIRDTADYGQIMISNFTWEESVITDPSATESDERWSSDEVGYILDCLFILLGTYAPDGYYFGWTVGDESDFGYWRIPEDIQKNT